MRRRRLGPVAHRRRREATRDQQPVYIFYQDLLRRAGRRNYQVHRLYRSGYLYNVYWNQVDRAPERRWEIIWDIIYHRLPAMRWADQRDFDLNPHHEPDSVLDYSRYQDRYD